MNKYKRKPRVLHLFNAFRIGGVEQQHLAIVRELRDTFEQTCWAINHGPMEDGLDEMGIPHCSGHFRIIPKMIELNEYDCIVMRTNRPLFVIADYLRDCPIPLVYIRSYLRWSEEHTTFFDPEWDPIGINVADYTLFSGPSLRNPTIELMGDIPGGEILYNGLDLKKYSMASRPAPATDKPLKVGMLSTIKPLKNQLKAIEVMREGLEMGSFELFIGGIAYDEEEYGNKVKEAAKNLPVHLLGYVDNPPEFLKGIDVLLMTSTLEGWPIAIMEALASGLPVVTADVGDVTELMGKARPGYIYPSGEYDRIPGLLAAMRDPETYETFSRLAVERAPLFDIQRTAQHVADAVFSVLK